MANRFSLNDYLVIDTTGKVGVGTIAPTAKFHLTGSGATSATVAINVLNSSASPLLYVRDDGYIGIGTTSPTSTLTIVGATHSTGSVLPGANTTYDLGSSTAAWRNSYAARFSGSHTTLIDGTSYIVAGSNITVTSQSNGSIVIASTATGGGGGDGDSNAQYLVLAATASLSNERVFTLGTGLSSVDAGAGGSYTLGINDSVVATVSGTTFTGNVKFNAGLSGSLTGSGLVSGSVVFAGPGSVLSGNLSQLHWNYNNNRFGIGTSTPSEKFEVVGVSGSLFSVSDSLSGSLFSVNTISGLPILEVFSDNTIIAGAFNTNAFIVTGSQVGVGTYPSGVNRFIVTGSSAFTGSVEPGVDNIYDLGSASKRWRAIYGALSGTSTITGLVSGSVVFAGALGILTGSVSQLHWNYANNRLGVGTSNPGYTLEVNGDFAATTKSFVIPHPTRIGWHLRHGSLEGPENGIYIRGVVTGSNYIELPEYWRGLVDAASITVQVTSFGHSQKLFIKSVDFTSVMVCDASIMNRFLFRKPSFSYVVYAARKDHVFQTEFRCV
jgi:hypothetical protein